MRSPFQNIVYVQLRHGWLSVRVLSWAGGDSRWDGAPEFITVRTKRDRLKVVEAGAQLRADWKDPQRWVLLSHPRTLIESVDAFGLGLKLFCARAGLRISPSGPIVIYHIMQQMEGGLTEIERQGFVSAAKGIKASRTLFLDDAQELGPPEILDLARQS